MDITALLGLTTWRVFDVDPAGRVLAGSDASGSVQLVQLDPDGTRTDLTALPGPCSGRWLPAERAVVVQHDTGGDENGQLSLLRLPGAAGPGTGDVGAALPAGPGDLVPLVHAAGVRHDLLDVLPGRVVYASNARNRVDFDVLVRDLATGVDTVLYDGGGLVAGVAVSPDAGSAVVELVAAAPASSRLVLATAGAPASELTDPALAAVHERPALTPDGTVVVSTDRGHDSVAVARLDPASGTWTDLVVGAGHDAVGWPSPDGRLLLVATDVDGEARVALHDTADGSLVRELVLPGGRTPAAGVVTGRGPDPVWSADSRSVALSFTAPGVPGAALLADVATGAVRELAGTAVDGPVSLPASHRVPAADGERIPCFVYPPSGAPAPGLAGSAVVVVHGGPEAQAARVFDPVVQGLAGAGHTVLVPNVRGSAGYGRRWVSLDDVRLRLDSVSDLAAIAAWAPTQDVRAGRIALWGGSYGGYMVLAGLTMQPELWAAGVDIVGISSLVTFLENTSPYRRSAREREYGSLADDRDFLHEASPLTHIDAVRAPLFVIHGANDPRVPLSEAEQLTEAVRSRGQECELLVYGDEGHGLARRANRLDAYPRAVAFLARHLSA